MQDKEMSVEELYKELQREVVMQALCKARDGEELSNARQLLRDNGVTDAGIQRHLGPVAPHLPEKPFEEPPQEQAS